MKIGIVSLGCPKNQVDSEVMVGLLKKAGHSMTASERDAEAIIINTCTFIREATEESIETILELSALREKGNLRHLVVAGCMAQRYKASLLKELPEIDAYVGTGEFDRIADVLAGLEKKKDVAGHEVAAPQYIYSCDTPRIRFTPRHWAYLKIAEGCDNHCTYCIIPELRGRMRSRAIKDVKAEAADMAAQGVKELCLIAQDTTAYGTDGRGRRSLAGLLREVEKVKGIEWVRLLYTHPGHFTPELIDFLSHSEKAVRYLDIPIQHIDADLLKAMGRGTKPDAVKRLIDSLRKKVPGVALRTSLMVGFPGETREKFMALLRFVKEYEFDHVGVFGYSDEEGAASSRLEKKVSDELIAERLDRLMKAQAKVSLKKNKARVGRTFRVLVDGPSKESELLLSGRAYFQAPEIDGVVYITDGDAVPGRFADVEITEAHEYDLVGRVI